MPRYHEHPTIIDVEPEQNETPALEQPGGSEPQTAALVLARDVAPTAALTVRKAKRALPGGSRAIETTPNGGDSVPARKNKREIDTSPSPIPLRPSRVHEAGLDRPLSNQEIELLSESAGREFNTFVEEVRASPNRAVFTAQNFELLPLLREEVRLLGLQLGRVRAARDSATGWRQVAILKKMRENFDRQIAAVREALASGGKAEQILSARASVKDLDLGLDKDKRGAQGGVARSVENRSPAERLAVLSAEFTALSDAIDELSAPAAFRRAAGKNLKRLARVEELDLDEEGAISELGSLEFQKDRAGMARFLAEKGWRMTRESLDAMRESENEDARGQINWRYFDFRLGKTGLKQFRDSLPGAEAKVDEKPAKKTRDAKTASLYEGNLEPAAGSSLVYKAAPQKEHHETVKTGGDDWSLVKPIAERRTVFRRLKDIFFGKQNAPVESRPDSGLYSWPPKLEEIMNPDDAAALKKIASAGSAIAAERAAHEATEEREAELEYVKLNLGQALCAKLENVIDMYRQNQDAATFRAALIAESKEKPSRVVALNGDLKVTIKGKDYQWAPALGIKATPDVFQYLKLRLRKDFQNFVRSLPPGTDFGFKKPSTPDQESS